MTFRLSPQALRQKAVVLQKAAQARPEKRKELLGAAGSLQLAANVSEDGLPEGAKPLQYPANEA